MTKESGGSAQNLDQSSSTGTDIRQIVEEYKRNVRGRGDIVQRHVRSVIPSKRPSATQKSE